MKKSNERTKKNSRLNSDLNSEFNPKQFKESRMTVKQVMDCFDICRTTVHNWEKENILKPTRIGRRVYYSLNLNKHSDTA